ncbi:MAG TPA: ATP-binding protein [Rhodopila sp.]
MLITSHGIRLATHLFWLVLAVSLPLLLVTGGMVWGIARAERQQEERALIDQARDASQAVDRTCGHLEDGLAVLSRSTALTHDDLADFQHELRLLASRLGDLPLCLTARNGDTLLCSGNDQRASAADETPIRQAAVQAIEAGKPVVTNLLAAVDPAARPVAVAVPAVRAAEKTADYVLVGTLDAARLSGLVAVKSTDPDGLVLTIRDRNEVVIARSLHPSERFADPARAGLREAIDGRPFGLLPGGATLEGAPAIRAFSVAPVSGFVVVAALPLGGIFAPIRRDLTLLVLIGAGLTIFGLCAATYLARRLVRPLQTLGRGEQPLPSGFQEVDELAARLRAASTKREAAEASLRDSEARLGDLIGTLDLAVIMARELNGTIRFWSHGCQQMYGWSRDEAVGGSSHELLRTQFPVPLPRIEQALLAGGEWRGELLQRRRDGTMVIVAAHKTLKRDADGHPHLVVESLVDVTALREAQEAFQTLNQELEDRVRDEVAARETAQARAANADRFQALGQLAGGMAHDFNNVLQAVAGGAALISRRPNDAAGVVRLAQLIRDAAARGASITRRMLVMARRSELNAEPIEVEALLDGLREVFVHTLGADIEVWVDVEANLPRVMVDKAQLETALVNLATNARDAMPDGGTLRLEASLDAVELARPSPGKALLPGEYVRLSVTDSGVGMSRDTLARLGEPFFTTKDVGKGTGLGLSMVKGFADQSGGAFNIDSAIGAGTTAALWLPVVAGESGQRPDEPVLPGRSRLTGRILLVEDDDLVRDTLVEQLQELGHKVLGASGGTSALAILRAQEAVDLMITDLSMPGMDGLMLIKEARGLCPSLPAILLTGFAGDVASLEDRDVSGATYTLIRKPATSAVLNARVTALLERS